MFAWFGYLVSAMAAVLTFFYGFAHNYGLAVVLLTIAVRIVIMPLYAKQMQSMRKMQQLQPEIKKLQEKYKGDPQKLNQSQMQLYKEYGVNPAAGCLPTLVQLPFLYALYDALRTYNYGIHSSFLWMSTLRSPDHLLILPILAGVSTFWQSWITSPPGTDRSQQMIILILMPAFIFYISLRLPAGLDLYWVVSNLFAVAQQYVMIARGPMQTAPVGPKP